MDRRGTTGRRIFIFCGLGPFAGSTSWGLFSSLASSSLHGHLTALDLGAALFSFVAGSLFFTPFAYLLGVWPALLLACVTCFYPVRLPTAWRIAASTTMGALLSCILLVFADAMGISLVHLLFAGASAGAICEWVISREPKQRTHRLRSKPAA